MTKDTISEAAHNHPWKVSDIVLFPLLAFGLLLEWLVPANLPVWRPAALGLGAVLTVAGFLLIRASKRILDAAGQPSLPEKPTTQLITSGLFAWSRNPNYLGAIIAVSGGVLLFGSAWIAVTTVVSAVILEVWMIRPEERYLRRVFGQDYEAYVKSTRRWF